MYCITQTCLFNTNLTNFRCDTIAALNLISSISAKNVPKPLTEPLFADPCLLRQLEIRSIIRDNTGAFGTSLELSYNGFVEKQISLALLPEDNGISSEYEFQLGFLFQGPGSFFVSSSLEMVS